MKVATSVLDGLYLYGSIALWAGLAIGGLYYISSLVPPQETQYGISHLYLAFR